MNHLNSSLIQKQYVLRYKIKKHCNFSVAPLSLQGVVAFSKVYYFQILVPNYLIKVANFFNCVNTCIFFSVKMCNEITSIIKRLKCYNCSKENYSIYWC